MWHRTLSYCSLAVAYLFKRFLLANRTYVPLVVAGGFGRACIGFDHVFWVATFKQTFGGQLSLDVADVGGRAHAVFCGGVVLFGFLVLI